MHLFHNHEKIEIKERTNGIILVSQVLYIFLSLFDPDLTTKGRAK